MKTLIATLLLTLLLPLDVFAQNHPALERSGDLEMAFEMARATREQNQAHRDLLKALGESTEGSLWQADETEAIPAQDEEFQIVLNPAPASRTP